MNQLTKSKIIGYILPINLIVFSLLVSVTGFSQTSTSLSQTMYHAGSISIIIEGTSNIHDWDMKSDKGTCTALFSTNPAGAIAAVSSLGFSMPAETLKSEHTTMDKNAYKAMNTSKNPTISFAAATVDLRPGGSGYILTAHGKLTINGVARDAVINASCTLNSDHSIKCTGSYKLKMTDFNVKPPSIMFGAIKTGDEINVKFDLTLRP